MIRGLVAVGRAQSTKPFEPIVRERVAERLAHALQYPIALVVAPAGFGKTVALRHHLHATRTPHVRYDVGRDDATLLGFVRGLVQALAPLEPKAPKSVAGAYERALKTNDPAAALATWFYAFLKDLHGTIFVDDLHVVGGEPRAIAFLADIMERSREHVRWIVTMRHQVDLPMATWLAYGHMDLPVDDVDLRLTLEEAARAARSCGVAMRPEELRDLVALTDGWPTAFTFALRVSTRTADFRRIASGTREMVYRYLAEQFFCNLAEPEQAFLLDTCLLPRLDVPTLQAGGLADAAAIVERLRRQTSFVVADSETAFHYHDLFRDFLEHRLRTAENSQYARVLGDSATVLETGGDVRGALRLHIVAGDTGRIVAALERSGLDLVARAELDLVETAIAALPADLRATSAIALGLRATLESIAGRYDSSDASFARAIACAGQASPLGLELTRRYAQDCASRLRTQRALELLAGLDISGVSDVGDRARMLGTLASVHAAAGQREPAREAAREALALVGSVDDEELRASTYHVGGFVAFHAGERSRALGLATRAAELAERVGFYGIAARACSVLAAVYDGADDAQNAYWTSQRMRGFAERAGDRGLVFSALTNMYAIDAIRGNADHLRTFEGKVREFDGAEYARSTGVIVSSYALQAAWMRDFVTAHAMLEGSADCQSSASRRAFRWAEIALYAAAGGNRDAAEAALRGSLIDVTPADSPGERARACRARIWNVLAQLLLGRAATANRVLAQLEAGAAEQPPVVRDLIFAARALYVHLETGASHDQVEASLTRLREHGAGGYALLFERLPLPTASAGGQFASLTKSELTILRAMARGGTSKVIAHSLNRSPQTVDTHVKAIVRKLGCRNRREAITRAIEAGIQ